MRASDLIPVLPFLGFIISSMPQYGPAGSRSLEELGLLEFSWNRAAGYSDGSESARRSAGGDFLRPTHLLGAVSSGPVDTRPVLSVRELVDAMERVLSDVPDFVPSLPQMSRLARAFLGSDGDSIRVGELGHGILGQFSARGEEMPRITLAREVVGLRARGVSLELLVPILVHELEHLRSYGRGERFRMSRNQSELRAFKTQALSLVALGPKLDQEAEKAHREGADPETLSYYEFLRRVRKAFFEGRLPELVRQLYGQELETRRDRP